MTEPEISPLVPVVYTMGKVASSSASTAIQMAGLPCHDIHTLNREKILETAKQWLERGEFPPPHICLSMTHRDQLFVKRTKCLYISLVRDPIARNLSAFFQNLHLMADEIRTEKDPKKMFEYFSNGYGHSLPLTWFDREFKAELGIDIFAQPFNQENKFVFKKAAKTILFRVDCPDDVKSRVLSKALGSDIKVGRVNDGANKDYNTIYNEMKNLVTFPAEFLNFMYDSKFVQYFWTPDEIEKMKTNWITK